MSTIVVTTAQDVTVDTFVQAAAEGKVKFYRQRSNGTYRHVQFLADGTEAREVAEWVANERQEGKTMKEIAKDMHLSVPSVRRILNSLLLTEEVEEYDAEDIEPLLAEAPAEAEALVGPVKEDGTF